jgi:hypothetical protein
MPIRYPTQQELRLFEGKNIKDICPRGFHNNKSNHCAHFVAHVLHISKGVNCSRMGGANPGETASVQVDTLFGLCASVGKWGDLPAGTPTCLAFVTSASNVRVSTKTMGGDPNRHIGFFIEAAWRVWHYDNKKDVVVSQRLDEFKFHYKESGYHEMYWGLLP